MPKRTQIVSVVNQKGGVGKTTTAVNLASFLAESGYRCLLIDMDPQGNATSGVGVQLSGVTTHIYHLLLAQCSVKDVLYPTAFDRLHVIPSNRDLAGEEVELVDQVSRETRLKEGLAPLLPYYDYIVIDCPPALGLLTLNALVASSKTIIPVQCEYFALEGIANLVTTLRQVKQHLNPSLEIAGIVLTMFDRRTALNRQVVENARSFFKELVFDTIIPRNIRLSEAPSHGLPIGLYRYNSKGARAYELLTKEVIQRV